MSAHEPSPSPSPRAPSGRLVGLLLVGIAVVLLVSSPTWFAGDRVVVGVAQLLVAVVLAAAGAFLLRRAARG
ncbi:hypothetical protein [Blastococcus saxobsidens]|uniref:Uncharacterized protein n=1 Tax=Blastococcus saxobsidens TaxID=138336 RepID=A0A4Q7YA55_9ACTN|nr:hypothetical protein [Blastococcus saxobsidens]RZU33698.1 hypothetical protein BKA19_3432 [Blastococcus saxobsidens]